VAIKFSGEFEVKRTPEEVYDFLTDPQKFAPLLPEFKDSHRCSRTFKVLPCGTPSISP